MRKIVLAATIAGALLTTQGVAAAQQTQQASAKADPRFGLGLATNFGSTPVDNAFVVRAAITPELTANAALGFRLQSGDFNEGTGFGIGVSGQYAAFKVGDVDFHLLGGLSYNRDSATDEQTQTTTVNNQQVTVTVETTSTNSDISLFGGVGAQYFFPNTNKRFSLQIDVGPAIHLLGVSNEVKTGNVKTSTDADAFVLSLAENLSSGVMFSYYFGDAK